MVARYDCGISNQQSLGTGVIEVGYVESLYVDEENMDTKLKCIGQMDNSDGTFESSNRVYDSNGIAPTLTCSENDVGVVAQDYRIRKLTPRECFRLMGVKDDDYNKLTVSNAQRYKQAGNSIVVDVLMTIFENMFVKDCKSNRLF